MNNFRIINIFAAPLLYFVELYLMFPIAYASYWSPICRILSGVLLFLWLATTLLWFLGVVDIVYRLIRRRDLQLDWYIPACILNILGLTVFFRLREYVFLWSVISKLLSSLG